MMNDGCQGVTLDEDTALETMKSLKQKYFDTSPWSFVDRQKHRPSWDYYEQMVHWYIEETDLYEN